MGCQASWSWGEHLRCAHAGVAAYPGVQRDAHAFEAFWTLLFTIDGNLLGNAVGHVMQGLLDELGDPRRSVVFQHVGIQVLGEILLVAFAAGMAGCRRVGPAGCRRVCFHGCLQSMWQGEVGVRGCWNRCLEYTLRFCF